MQCFKKLRRHSRTVPLSSGVPVKDRVVINNLLRQHNAKYTIQCNDNRRLGEILFTHLLLDTPISSIYLSPNGVFTQLRSASAALTSASDIVNVDLVKALLKTKLIDINEIKNFLNQTLLHIISEKNLVELCVDLVGLGANCMLEDNYRQTPLLIAAKSNYFSLLKVFCDSIKRQSQMQMYENYTEFNLIKSQQIFKAAYYACCSNNYEIVEYLFETFELYSEQLQFDDCVDIVTISDDDARSNSAKVKLKYELNSFTSELNALHVACYNSYFRIVRHLVDHSRHTAAYINTSINKFRDSTPLEEAFKGLLTLNLNYEIEINQNRKKYFAKIPTLAYEVEKQTKRATELEYKQIIDYLIQNGAKFSHNFMVNNDLARMAQQVFYGELKHLNFIHYLNCLEFLFQYKVEAMFQFEGTRSLVTIEKDKVFEQKTCDSYECCLSQMLSELLNKLYSILLKILKDYKQLSYAQYLNIVSLLANERNNGKIKLNIEAFSTLKERNSELYACIRKMASKPLSLQQLALVKIKHSIQNFSIDKVTQLNLPSMLKTKLVPEYKHLNLDFF